jgi:hypothetical protein
MFLCLFSILKDYVTTLVLAYVTDCIALDAPDLQQTLEHLAGADIVPATLMHELSHVVSVGHVQDPTQLIHRRSTEPNTATHCRALDRAGHYVPQL